MDNWWTSRSKIEYEPLDPLTSPRRGQKKAMKMAGIFGAVGLVVTAFLIVVILQTTKVTDGNTNQLLLLQATGENSTVEGKLILKAEEDMTPGEVLSPTASNLTSEPEKDIVVKIDQGLLQGMKLMSRRGREYLAFQTIPYAKPPLGELRFQPPVEAEPWEGTLNATKLLPECLQKVKLTLDFVVRGSEDCLYLNIFTPKKFEELGGRRKRFPVMVYIHGGGATGDVTRYQADYFMDQDVVLVTIHFRLGALGNLNTNDSSARGNQGMKDQVMALQWIKNNINNFGGDSKKVTLFGNSFGGMQISTHLLSPMSKGLFHRAICQSGVLLMPSMLNENPSESAFDLGDRVNCTSKNSFELVNCLRGIKGEDIIHASYRDPFVVTIEPPSENNNEDTILPGHPLTLLQNGDVNDIPVIFGVNSGESLAMSLQFLINSNLTKRLNDDWNETLSTAFGLDFAASDPYAMAHAAKQFYFGDKNLTRETQANLTNLATDRNYIHPVVTTATFQSEYIGRRNKVFLYYFDREVGKKYSEQPEELYGNTEFLGASHADELQLLFPYDDFPYVSLDSEYANLSLAMVKLWTTFAADGKPSGVTNEWLPIEANQKPYQFYQLDDSPRMVEVLGDRMEFWDSFNLTDLYVAKHPENPETPKG